jgi:hypothetical protein
MSLYKDPEDDTTEEAEKSKRNPVEDLLAEVTFFFLRIIKIYQ